MDKKQEAQKKFDEAIDNWHADPLRYAWTQVMQAQRELNSLTRRDPEHYDTMREASRKLLK